MRMLSLKWATRVFKKLPSTFAQRHTRGFVSRRCGFEWRNFALTTPPVSVGASTLRAGMRQNRKRHFPILWKSRRQDGAGTRLARLSQGSTGRQRPRLGPSLSGSTLLMQETCSKMLNKPGHQQGETQERATPRNPRKTHGERRDLRRFHSAIGTPLQYARQDRNSAATKHAADAPFGEELPSFCRERHGGRGGNQCCSSCLIRTTVPVLSRVSTWLRDIDIDLPFPSSPNPRRLSC
jgi:hypothetical protein